MGRKSISQAFRDDFMNRCFTLQFASLLLAGISQGCGNAPRDPETVVITAPAETAKSVATPIADDQSLALEKLQNSDRPAERRDAANRLGVQLCESWQKSAGKSPESVVRLKELQSGIIDKLSKLGPDATGAVPAFKDILNGNAPPSLKLQIMELLQRLKLTDKRLGPAIAHASRDTTLREPAVRLLIQLGCADRASVAALGQALQNPDLLDDSLRALAGLEDRAVVPASRFLMEVAASSQQPLKTRTAVIAVMGKFTHAGVPDLSLLWSDDDPAIRIASMKLGINDGNLLVKEQNPEVIAAAFEGLGRPPIKATYLAQVFEQALKKESLRGAVNQFLKEHPDKVVGTLLQLFKSDSALIRDYSIDLFASLANDGPVVAELEATLGGDDPGLQALAAIKLGKAPSDSDTDLEELAERAAKWITQPKLKSQVLELLAAIGADAIPALAQLMTDSRLDSEIKAAAFHALLTVPDAVAVAPPILKSGLESDDPATRRWAAVGLLKLGSGEAKELEALVSPLVADALKSTDPYLIQAMLEALSERPQLGTALSGDILLTLQHASPEIRKAAILTLVKVELTSKIPDLVEALKKVATGDSDEEVRKQAAAAVKQLEEPAK
jgi:HEAT repeat protein